MFFGYNSPYIARTKLEFVITSYSIKLPRHTLELNKFIVIYFAKSLKLHQPKASQDIFREQHETNIIYSAMSSDIRVKPARSTLRVYGLSWHVSIQTTQ